ncbi:MAG: hypothetical protein V3T08_08005 [Gemmatimonadota bacterium]
MGILNRRRTRARQELQEQLSSIFSRLDHLESAPTSRSTELAIEKHVATQLEEVTRELASVRGFAAGVHGQVGELEKKVDDWKLAIAEGIERTDRAERRIRAAIQRARKELAKLGYEDAGLESEAEELRLVNGGGGKDDGVQPLREGMAAVDDAPSSIPGVPASVLRRVRGF